MAREVHEPHARHDEMDAIRTTGTIDTPIERPSAAVIRGGVARFGGGPDGGAIGRTRLAVIGEGNAAAGKLAEQHGPRKPTVRGNGKA